MFRTASVHGDTGSGALPLSARDGTGRTVDIIELGGGFQQRRYPTCWPRPALVTAVAVDGAHNNYTGNPNSADGEVALDIQVVGDIVQRPASALYFAPNTTRGFLDASLLPFTRRLHRIASRSVGARRRATGHNKRGMPWKPCSRNSSPRNPVFAASGDGGSAAGPVPTSRTFRRAHRTRPVAEVRFFRGAGRLSPLKSHGPEVAAA